MFYMCDRGVGRVLQMEQAILPEIYAFKSCLRKLLASLVSSRIGNITIFKRLQIAWKVNQVEAHNAY